MKSIELKPKFKASRVHKKVPRGKKQVESEKYKLLILKRKNFVFEASFDRLQKKINTKLVQYGKNHLKVVDGSEVATA